MDHLDDFNEEESYVVMLENFTYWKNKKRYLELMESFIDGKMDGKEFDTEFDKMWKRDRDRTYSLEELLNIEENIDLTKFIGFSGIISKVFIDCQFFEPDPALDYGISEEELRNYVKEALLEIKNGYP